MSARTIFCVSDHTGVTAETLAHSLVSRFNGIDARYVIRPFIDSAEKAQAVVAEVNSAEAAGERPVVFSSLVTRELRRILDTADALVLGLFESFDDRLENEFGSAPSTIVGSYHGMGDTAAYQLRLDAIDFSLATDDGLGTERYPHADLIVVGVSRVGKTPTCLYLSMHYVVRAANFPIIDSDLDIPRLPEALQPYEERLFGLTIDPVRLHQIREKRRPDSEYASIEQCRADVGYAERLFRSRDIPALDTTVRSIEEITATIIDTSMLPRRLD